MSEDFYTKIENLIEEEAERRVTVIQKLYKENMKEHSQLLAERNVLHARVKMLERELAKLKEDNQ